MTDILAARVRTWWPLIIGHLAAWVLLTAAPILPTLESWGWKPTPEAVATALGFILAGLVWEAGRRLSGFPGESGAARTARFVGRWLVSLGLHTGPPTYPASAR